MEPISIITAAMGLAKLVPGIIGLFKGKDAEEKAAGVVKIAQDITGVDDPQTAVDGVINDPALATQFKEKMLDHTLAMREADNTQLEIVNATIRAELSSTDKYNSRWRATFGYMVAFSWFVTFAGLVTAVIIIVVKSPDKLGEILTALGTMMANTSMLWGVALSILGITVHKRSKDKETAAGVSSTGSLQNLLSMFKR